jgi:hypothetical protein
MFDEKHIMVLLAFLECMYLKEIFILHTHTVHDRITSSKSKRLLYLLQCDARKELRQSGEDNYTM